MTPATPLLDRIAAGDVRAVARACRMVDERWPGHTELLAELFRRAHASWWIGVTGSPGVGKSTLVSRLVQHMRASGQRVGVVAVDPSSPFSGGALLGDRIRMQAHWADPEVFIRSVATRGALGGLSRSTADVARVLGAWGAQVVLLETVGVGQDEIDVMHVAHSTLVVQAPGAGDDLQASKAGLLECADVFAVNKADLPGAESAAQYLRSMLALGRATASASGLGSGHLGSGHLGAGRLGGQTGPGTDASGQWEVPVLTCVAARDEGVAEILDALRRHFHWLTSSAAGQARRVARSRAELTALLRDRLTQALLEQHQDELEQIAQDVSAGRTDPYSASRDLIRSWTRLGSR